MAERDEYDISDDPRRLDRDGVYAFLADSYWARGIPRPVFERALDHSALCLGAYRGSEQVGFARVISDRATFAYLCDVFVLPEHRGRGIARRMVRAILDHPDLRGLRRFLLATADAHPLYAEAGFVPLAAPDRWMEIARGTSVYGVGEESEADE